MTAHLPAPDTPWACPLCSVESWPCSRFDSAAHELMRAGLRLVDWVPYDLHPRLWPPHRGRAARTFPTPPAVEQLVHRGAPRWMRIRPRASRLRSSSAWTTWTN